MRSLLTLVLINLVLMAQAFAQEEHHHNEPHHDAHQHDVHQHDAHQHDAHQHDANHLNCKSHDVHQELYKLHPESRAEHEAFNGFTRRYMANPNHKIQAATYQIPVVVHVFGTSFNGASVTQQTVENAIAQVNEEFQGLNADYNTVDPLFNGIKASMDIEFVLAGLDPNGNATTGVLFHPKLDGFGDCCNANSQIQQYAWDNYKYMNVYIQNDLYNDGSTTNSGVAWYPDTYMSDNNLARVVHNGAYLTGNTNQEFASVFTHEFGHWMNLIHTFEGGCTYPNDEVTDTPPEDSSVDGECNGANNCEGNPINSENYMGYNGASGCYKMFTQGQVSRMLAALQHPARQPLWQQSNLIATGVVAPTSPYFSVTNTTQEESLANDGTLSTGSSTLTLLNGGQFTQSSGSFTQGTHYTVSNLPSGLSANLTVNSSSTLTVSFSGAASSHANANDVEAIITFLNPAIQGGAGQLLTDEVKYNFNFRDPYQVVYEDIADLVTNSTATWNFFRTLVGDNSDFGAWYDTGNGNILRLETYTKPMVCEGSTRNISVLPYGTPISSSSNWVAGGAYPDEHDLRKPSYTAWDGQEAYMGVQVEIGGLPCYGWMRVSVSGNGQEFTVKDYAISTQPYGTLLAGYTTLGGGGPVTPVANFTASPTAIETGQSVSFTDASSNSPTAWSWSFPGGSPASSSAQSPTVTYNTAGTYSVTLTASNSAGADSETKTAYITVTDPVPTPPVADFSASATSIITGGSVNFTDGSSNSPTAWSWSFPGGSPSSSTAQNPSVTYNTAGTYNVTLTATNADGSDSETKNGYITVTDPVVSYCSATGGGGYEWIGNVSIGSFSNGSGEAGYTDFTAQTISLNAGANVPVTLTPAFNSSAYTEHWTIWIDYNGDGDFTDAGEQVLSGLSGNSAVSGSFTVASSASGVTRLRIAMKYNGAASSPCGDIGDGEVEDYTVSFTPAAPQAPVAAISASATAVNVGESVTLNDASSNTPTSWSWSMPNGTPSSSSNQNTSVSYASAGTYTVTLTATNAVGSDSESVTITVIDAPPASYCTPSSSLDYNEIQRVTFAGIDQVSGWSSYSDYTGGTAASVNKGSSYTLTIEPENDHWSDIDVQAWIDWNADGDFTDANERVYARRGPGPYSVNVAVPSSAASGATRLRVRLAYGKTPGPCEVDTYQGESEDYTVNIGGSAGVVGIQQVNLFPNPNTGRFTVAVATEATQGELTLRLVDLAGRTVFEGREPIAGHMTHARLDVSGVETGVYQLIVTDGANTALRYEKVIIH